MSEPHGLTVVERTQLRILLKEHKLAESGILDAQTVRKLGQIANVDVVVTGTITPLGDSVKLSLKAMDASTAKIVAAQATEIPRTKAIDELLARGLADDPSDSPQRNANSSTHINPVPTAKNAVQAVTSVAQNGFQFDLTGCTRAAGNVRCGFRLQNLETEDREIYIFANTRAVDDTGAEWESALRRLSSSEGKGRYGNTVTTWAVPGVPVTGTLGFAGGAAAARVFVLLELECNSFRVQFRNIAIE